MAYPTASGTASFHGTFTPEIWSLKFLQKFYQGTCMSDIFNTDWQGEIKAKGDTVNIRHVPTVAIHDHEDDQDLVYQGLEGAKTQMLIDQGKYWAFKLPKVQAGQVDVPVVNKATEDGSENMKIAIETDIFASWVADPQAANKGLTAGADSGDVNLGVSGTPLAVNKANIIDLIVDMGTVLDEAKVPETGRYLILPSWVAGMIKKSDVKDASMTGDSQSILRTGRLGIIDRFTCYRSQSLPRVTDTVRCTYIMAGHKVATSFASQITEQETLKNPKGFGDLYRGLQVYGYKTTNPEALCAAYIRKG